MEGCSPGDGGTVEVYVCCYGKHGCESDGCGEGEEREGFAEEVREEVEAWGEEESGEGDAGEGAEGDEGAEDGGGDNGGAVLRRVLESAL